MCFDDIPIGPWQQAPASQLQSQQDTEYDNEVVDHNANAICQGYLSDLSLESGDIDYSLDSDLDTGSASKPENHSSSSRNFILPNPKRRKLDIPARTVREQAKQVRSQDSELKDSDALRDIEKLLVSKKTRSRPVLTGCRCTFNPNLPADGCQ